jgi:ATP-dependent protease ClpP protease subunit
MNDTNGLLELLSIEPQEQRAGMIKTQKQEMFLHQVFLDEDIGAPSKYRELISALYSASEMDVFNLIINSSGGAAASCGAIVEAIQGTDATVRAVLLGDCHSAASIIALNCDEVIVSDSATMMIHTASFGTSGNTHLVKGYVDFSHKVINKLLDKTYTGFLSEQELNNVKMGHEVWLDSEEIGQRLTKRAEIQKAEYEKLLKEETKAKKPVPKKAPAKNT